MNKISADKPVYTQLLHRKNSYNFIVSVLSCDIQDNLPPKECFCNDDINQTIELVSMM